jgi:hypothetical protein
MGRNIFRSEAPKAMIETVHAVVHKKLLRDAQGAQGKQIDRSLRSFAPYLLRPRQSRKSGWLLREAKGDYPGLDLGNCAPHRPSQKVLQRAKSKCKRYTNSVTPSRASITDRFNAHRDLLT